MTLELDSPIAGTAAQATFRCFFCDYDQPVKTDLAGRRVRCPRCGRVSRVAEPRNPWAVSREPDESENAPMSYGPTSSGYQAETQPADGESPKRAIPVASRGPAESHATRVCPHCHKPLDEAPAEKAKAAATAQAAPNAPPAPAAPPARPATLGPPAAVRGSPNPNTQKPAAAPSPPVARLPSAAPAPRTSPAIVTAGKAAEEPTIRCPYCREEIHAYSRKCKHCGEYLEETLRVSRAQMLEAVQSHKGRGFSLAGLSLTNLSRRQRIAALVVVLVVAVGGGYAILRAVGGGASGNHRAAPGAKGSSGAGADDREDAAPTIEPLAAALKKALEGAEVKDYAGSATQFPAPGTGVEPWAANVAGDKGVIHMPYRFASVDPKVPSTRGRIILELTPKGGRWQATGVFREACFQGPPGREAEIPDDDRQTLRQPDQDPAARRILEAVRNAAPKP